MIKKQWLILTLMLTMLALAACTTPASACPSATADLKLLMNAEDGYCLLSPADYSTDVPHFIIINPAVPMAGDTLGEAWVSIDTEAAAGRTPAQVAEVQIAAVGPGFNIERSDVLVDGEQAVVIDGLPGPDSWRKVFIVSNERLYTLTFLPWAPNINNPAQPTPLEGLYTTIIDTLHFLPPTKAQPPATQQ